MTKYWNKKYDFSVEAYRIEPGKTYEGIAQPTFGKLFADLPEPYWVVRHDDTQMLISDELFQRFFVREPAHA
jgi:hypothetical protein